MVAADIDIERAIWDAEYRRSVIAFLNGTGARPANENLPPVNDPGSVGGQSHPPKRSAR